MDNKTIRNALLKRIPEVYYIGKPIPNKGKVNWLMYAKIPGINRPVMLIADMPDTAILSHKELLSTMINEIADEIKALRTGRKAVKDDPTEIHPPLSYEGQKVFDSEDIQYMDLAPSTPGLILP